MENGNYAADSTGYLEPSIVNFDLTVIDVPQLASSSNELLEWERNPDTTPKAGTKVTMVIEPVGLEHQEGQAASVVPSAPAPSAAAATTQPLDVDAEIHAADKTAAAHARPGRTKWPNTGKPCVRRPRRIIASCKPFGRSNKS